MKLDRLFYALMILSTLALGCEPGVITHRCDSPYTCPLPEPRPAEEPASPPVIPTGDEPTGSALIPAPAVGDEHGYGTVPATPVTPSGCTAGEVEDWGEDARNIRIAGSSTGYAVAYDSDMTHVRMVAPDGAPTSADNVLPPTSTGGWPEIGSSRDGYIVAAAVAGSIGPGVYVMGQDGAIKSSALSELRDNVAAVQIIGGTLETPNTLVWQNWGDGTASNTCIMAGDLSDTDAVWGKRELACQYFTGGWWWHMTAAARGETSMAFAVISGNSGDRWNFVDVWVTGSFGSKVLRLSGTYFGSTRAIRMLAVPGGYAVLVERNADVNGDGNWERAAILAFVGEDGELERMVDLPEDTADFAWNGTDFGMIGWKYTGHIQFHLVGSTGELKQTLTVAPADIANWSVPKIAASSTNFALVWADQTLKFTTVSCH